MQLDKIIIELRQRSPWEAMDLGVMLMRKLWPVIFLPWLIMMSIVLAFVLFAQSQGFMYFGGFFMWLIKPVYESLILFIISRGIFGEYLTSDQVYSSLGSWIKTGLLTTFSHWRISPSRSFNMSVHLLEGLGGTKRRQRLESLHRVKGSHSTWLTVIGLHFEYIVGLTLYALVFFIAPTFATDYMESMIQTPDDQLIWFFIGSVIYAITLFILEPFYVAAGFMLYLNRRTQLEGWDVELEFKNIAQRINEENATTDQGIQQ